MSGKSSHSDPQEVGAKQQEGNPDELVEWIEKYDETYNLYYYLNSITGECQWDSPFAMDDAPHDQLPPGTTADEHHHEDQYKDGRNAHDNHTKHTDSHEYHHEHGEYHKTHQEAHREGHDTHDAQLHHQEQDYTQAWNDYYAQQGHPTYYEQEDFQQQQIQEFPFDYDSDEAGDQYEHYDYEPYDEEAAPKSIKNRSKDLQVGGSNQDYVHMARMYKLTRPYSDPDYTGLCVLCHTNFADMVFFPCEHRCVCSECVQNESICSDIQMESVRDGYCNCSLCAGIIKLILPSEGGAEVEKYWNWVYEEPAPLPSNFLRNFRHSEAVIKAVHVRNGDSKNVDSFENASKSCAVS